MSGYIDDQPAYLGTSDIERYEPWELHSIEVFDFGHVRVHTREYMQDVLQGKKSLRPKSWFFFSGAGGGM
ncbi:MAG: hypothetical protein GWP44_07690 [Proteobacteria bacterium]|nr:hypothetical protein [Pseudomonadota bacterium]